MNKIPARFLRLIGTAALFVALIGAAQRTVSTTWQPAIATRVGTSAPAAPFRLGTAARPFGWATAVADFNRDGLADTAVADRRSRVGAGYRYELRLSVSGLESRSVLFESLRQALTVSIRDVDHDNDLDVVVSDVVSSAVTNVWLNDGHGRFTEAVPAPEHSRIEAAGAIDTGRPCGDVAAGTTIRERSSAALIVVSAAPVSAESGLGCGRRRSRRLSDPTFTLPLRAPPASLPLFS